MIDFVWWMCTILEQLVSQLQGQNGGSKVLVSRTVDSSLICCWNLTCCTEIAGSTLYMYFVYIPVINWRKEWHTSEYCNNIAGVYFSSSGPLVFTGGKSYQKPELLCKKNFLLYCPTSGAKLFSQIVDLTMVPGSSFLKAPETFQFLINLHLKTKKRKCTKLCMKRTSLHVKNMWIKQVC